MLSIENNLLCMFQRLCPYFQDTGVLVFGGYVLSGHCSRQQISGQNEGYLFSEGYLFTGFYGKNCLGEILPLAGWFGLERAMIKPPMP